MFSHYFQIVFFNKNDHVSIILDGHPYIMFLIALLFDQLKGTVNPKIKNNLFSPNGV